MPIYTYECPTDGYQDVFSRTYDVREEQPCPECGEPASIAVTMPALVTIERDWNDKASDDQRDPYTQAKAQLRNLSREEQLRHDKPPIKVTEEMLQAGAKAIHEGKTNPPVSPVVQTQRLQRERIREKKQRKEE